MLSASYFRLRGHWFKTQQRHCILSLSKTLYPLFSTGSTQEKSYHDGKIVGWDVKHEHKQTTVVTASMKALQYLLVLVLFFSLQFDPAPRRGEPHVTRRTPDYFL